MHKNMTSSVCRDSMAESMFRSGGTSTGSGATGAAGVGSGATGNTGASIPSRPAPSVFVSNRRVSWPDPRMSEPKPEIRDEQDEWWRFPFRLVRVHLANNLSARMQRKD